MKEASVTVPVARAIRFAFVCFLLVPSYFNIRGSFLISNFKGLFSDMLEGHSLPLIASFVLANRWLFITTSVLLPSIALATLRDRNILRSFYVLGALALMTLIQIIFLYQGLCAPLSTLINLLGSSSTK